MSDENLGRFGHHPDPAIDFEIEVEALSSLLYNAFYLDAGLFAEFKDRSARALGSSWASAGPLAAKHYLRRLTAVKTRGQLLELLP